MLSRSSAWKRFAAACLLPCLLVMGAAHAADAPASHADPAVLDQVKQAFEGHFPGVDIENVRPTPFENLYEVQIANVVVYTNGSADFVLEGGLIDSRTRSDLTAQRLEELSKIDFQTLPLDLAIKQVKGTGEPVFAVFEDPLCGFCKRLHQNLAQVDNYTMYTFLYPILAPESETRSRDVWCSADPAAAWRAWMLEGKVPAAAKCDTPFEQTAALARRLGVQGTPLTILSDGSQIKGAIPLDQLQARLKEVQTPGSR